MSTTTSTPYAYGVAAGINLYLLAAHVCETLSPLTAELALPLVLETAAQETQLGNFPDRTPTSAGVGLGQIDPIAFIDIQNRTPKKRKTLIRETWGIDINILQHRDLAYSPLLSFIFIRLFYALIQDPLPRTLPERAAYWKRYYNTRLGDGTISQYVQTAAHFFPTQESYHGQ